MRLPHLKGPSVWQLLGPQRIAGRADLRDLIRSWKLPVIGGLTLLCAWGCYVAGDFIFGQLARTELLAPLLMRKTVGFIYDFFGWMLLFSTVVTAFATHYLSDDLARLIHAPISPVRLYLSRCVSAWAQTSWMLLLFALPTLAGAGVRLGAPISFYLTITLSLALMSIIYAISACTLTLIIARFIPAKRVQDVMIFVFILAFVYFYTQLQSSRPDRFFQEDGFKDLVDMLNNLREVGGGEGVSSWSVAAIFGTLPSQEGILLSGHVERFGLGEWPTAMLKLAGSALGVTALSATLSRWLYLPGFWLSQEGIGTPKRARKGRSKPRSQRSPSVAIAHRETLLFWRTPSQWTQLLLIGSLVTVYLFNFKYFKTLHISGFFSYLTLFYAHLGFSSMILITIAARFLFPSVSMEGKALWVLQSAPISARQVLRAKMRWGFWPMWGLSIALVALGAWITDLGLLWTLIGAWASTLLSVGVVSLGVGMGALKPRFDLANPMMVASSLLGATFMLLALLYLVLLCALSYPIIRDLDVLYKGFHVQPYGLAWWALSFMSLHALCALVYWGALKFGTRGLERALLKE